MCRGGGRGGSGGAIGPGSVSSSSLERVPRFIIDQLCRDKSLRLPPKQNGPHAAAPEISSVSCWGPTRTRTHAHAPRLLIDVKSHICLPPAMFVARLVFSYTTSATLWMRSRLIWTLMAFTVWVYLRPSVTGATFHSISQSWQLRSLSGDS